MIFDSISELELFTNVINKYLDCQYTSEYFQNAFLCTLLKNIYSKF